MLRLPPDLHARLREAAAASGLSLNQYCVAALRAAVFDQPASNRAAWLDAARAEFAQDLAGVVLFGSTARGTRRAGSDVDLLIVLNSGASITRELYRRWDRAVGTSGPETPHFVRLPLALEDAGGIWFEAAMDGVVLHDSDGRVAGVLAEMRRAAAHGAVRRGVAHGHPYWVRGPEAKSHA